jgi:hypothetical protein
LEEVSSFIAFWAEGRIHQIRGRYPDKFYWFVLRVMAQSILWVALALGIAAQLDLTMSGLVNGFGVSTLFLFLLTPLGILGYFVGSLLIPAPYIIGPVLGLIGAFFLLSIYRHESKIITNRK